MRLFCLFLVLALCLIIIPKALSQQNDIANIGYNDAGLYEKFEFAFNLTSPTYANPYDPDEVSVYALFYGPGNNSSEHDYYRPGFHYIGYDVDESVLYNPPVAPHDYWKENHSQTWRIRFSPDKVGDWTFMVYVDYSSPAGSGNIVSKHLYTGNFTCNPSGKSGFVSVHENRRYLQFDNEDIYFPIGENMAGFFGDRGGLMPDATYVGSQNCNQNHLDLLSSGDICGADPVPCYSPYVFSHFRRVFKDIAPEGGNFIRLWFLPTSFEFEWEQLGSYDQRQNRMFDLDAIVESGNQEGIYFHVVLSDKGIFDSDYADCDGFTGCWDDTPYSRIMPPGGAGFLAPAEFFTEDIARDYYKKRLYYFVARWGYSPNVFSVEFINEVDFIRSTHQGKEVRWKFWQENRPAISAWHKEMANYLEELAPHILKTVSTGMVANGDDMHTEPGPDQQEFVFDYTKGHFYSCSYNSEHQRDFLAKRQLGRHPKPFHLQETDDCTANRVAVQTNESTAVKWHNWLWSSTFTGAMGAGVNLSYDSHFHHPCYGAGRLFRYFQPLSRFIAQIPLGETGINSFVPVGNAERAVESAFPGALIDSPNCECGEPVDDCTLGASPPYSVGCDLTDGCSAGFADPGFQYSNFSRKYDYRRAFLSSDIATSNDDEIEVFALRNPSMVCGWVHNKTNFWYNLYRAPSSNESTFCSYNSGLTSGGHTVTPLMNETMEITGLDCGGSYKVEWWYTYFGLDVDGNGNPDDGGIIADYTQTVTAINGKATVNIPSLIARTDAVDFEAPDYGFCVKLMEPPGSMAVPNWNHAQETWNFWEEVAGDVKVTPDNSVIYVGSDQHIHILRWQNNDWVHDELTNGNAEKAGINTNLAVSAAGQVFYRGTDRQIHQLYGIGPNGAQHTKLTWNSWQVCLGDIEVTSQNEVVYHGVGDVINKLTWNGQSWAFNALTSTQDPDIDGDLAASYNNQLYFRSSNGMMYQVTGLATASPSVYLVADDSGNGFLIDPDGHIEVSRSNKVFYKHDSEVKYVDWNGESWEGFYAASPNAPDDDIGGEFAVSAEDEIFYEGFNGQQVHLIYDIQPNGRKHQVLTNSTAHKVDGHIAVSHANQVFYKGGNDQIHTLYFTCGESGLTQNRDPQKTFPSGSSTNNYELRLYPNPAFTRLNIELEADGKESGCTYQIYNSLGQPAEPAPVTMGKYTIVNTSSFSSGLYFIKVFDSNGRQITSGKFVVPRY